jgi:flagellar hook-length control protein FliK
VKVDAAREKTDPLSIAALDTEGLVTSETRSTSTSSPQSLAQILSRPETPSMIARQMAEVLQRLPDRPVEISLSPKELGRVRMNISAVETGITVSVLAERPETLDLMRRNIDQLVREFQAIGYENINFAFSEGEAKQQFADNQSDTAGTSETVTRLDLTPMEDTAGAADPVLRTGGIDIRL